MKVLLLSTNLADDPFPVYPLGMSVVAEAVHNAGYEVCQYDPLAMSDSPQYFHLQNLLTNFKPDAIGLSIRNLDTVNHLAERPGLLEPAFRISSICRLFCPHVPLILGGSGYSLAPEALLQHGLGDYGIAGPGESAFPALLEIIRTGTPVKDSVIRSNGKNSVQSGARYDPAIAAFYDRETHMLPVQTKRGCPFHCAYCSYPLLEGRTVIPRDVDIVAGEVASLHRDYPDSMIYFVDAVFNDPSGCYRTLLERLKKAPEQAPFNAFLSPFQLDLNSVKLLKESGMIAAELGIDAASNATLHGMGKKFSWAEAETAANALLDAGISVTANFIFGGPGETLQTVREGIAHILSIPRMCSMVFSGIRIIPGTPLFHKVKRLGMIPAGWDGVESVYYFDPALDLARMETMLRESLSGRDFCIYPPQSKRQALAAIHKIGLPGFKKMFGGRG